MDSLSGRQDTTILAGTFFFSQPGIPGEIPFSFVWGGHCFSRPIVRMIGTNVSLDYHHFFTRSLLQAPVPKNPQFPFYEMLRKNSFFDMNCIQAPLLLISLHNKNWVTFDIYCQPIHKRISEVLFYFIFFIRAKNLPLCLLLVACLCCVRTMKQNIQRTLDLGRKTKKIHKMSK